MQIIPNETLLSRVSSEGLRLGDRYDAPLSYQNNLWFAAPMPENARDRSKAIFAALDLIDDTPIYLYRRTGIWNFCQRSNRTVRDTRDRAFDSLLKLLNIPDGLIGTLLFQPSEKDLLYALLYMNSIAAGNVTDDLFVVPDHQGFTFYFDHDEQIILECRDEPTRIKIADRFNKTWSNIHLPPFHH